MFDTYMAASKSVSDFMSVCCCEKQKYPHLTLPHLPDTIPEFYPLRCCKEAESTPSHVTTCMECGWHNNRSLYRYFGCIERSDQPAHWMQWRDTEVNGRTRPVFRKREGTRKGLLDHLFGMHRKYLFHKWVHRMTAHQEALDVATFNGETAIVVKADFAATVEIKQENQATCEYGTHANLFVALVLHSPEPLCCAEPGAARPVKCDIWRVFSNAKPSAMVHQMVMRRVAEHYKALIPTLEWMHLKTDGCASQFKGRFNFYCVSGGKFGGQYSGIKQRHNFTAPGHGGGPVDNAGKVAKDYLSRLSAHKKQTAYDYATAFRACSQGMQSPSNPSAAKGTWGCNGKHFWCCISDGTDAGKREFDVVPSFGGDVSTVPGSRTMFGFRASDTPSSRTASTIMATFMDCYCAKCRNGRPGECNSGGEFGSWQSVVQYVKRQARRMLTRQIHADMPCMVCSSTGDKFLYFVHVRTRTF
jgi:hypothetical protein